MRNLDPTGFVKLCRKYKFMTFELGPSAVRLNVDMNLNGKHFISKKCVQVGHIFLDGLYARMTYWQRVSCMARSN
jgi:hypothetical protein